MTANPTCLKREVVSSPTGPQPCDNHVVAREPIHVVARWSPFKWRCGSPSMWRHRSSSKLWVVQSLEFIDNLSGKNYTQMRQVALELLMNGSRDGSNFNNPHQFQSNRKNQCVVVLLIYKSFGMSLIWFELILRIARFIFPQLKNDPSLEFSALLVILHLKPQLDTRLSKQTHSVKVLLSYLLMSIYDNTLILTNCDLLFSRV
jgi:hypothetical protein